MLLHIMALSHLRKKVVLILIMVKHIRDLESIELQKCTLIFTLATCFRNCVDPFPFEVQVAKLGDRFIWLVIGEYGKGKFLKDIKPVMYRVHDGGIFSKKLNNKESR